MSWRKLCIVSIIGFALGFGVHAARAEPTIPTWWLRQADCIHRHESIDWHWGPNHHPGQRYWNHYYGGYQFTLGTWQSTFGPREKRGYTYYHPETATPLEQTLRAYINWAHNGHRWGGGQWPTSSRICGVP